ncbi:MAG TPA: DUF2892 domain-containing protein [Bacteroidales bacterium]|jgi:fatty acid desaturase|nr:DUF2892 domain-containing protein [Bacteroidales bacterium]
MKTNVGKTDRLIRLLLALLGIVLYIFNVITGTAGIVVLVIAAVLILTALINFCPLYTVFGLSTCKKGESK